MPETPTTESGLRQYDHLAPKEAALLARTVKGDYPAEHDYARSIVRSYMPVLARALDRLSAACAQCGGKGVVLGPHSWVECGRCVDASLEAWQERSEEGDDG